MSDVVDEGIFAVLNAHGFETNKQKRYARHFVNAAHNACDVLLTNDPLFMRLRSQLHARYPSVRILKPTELLKELRAKDHSPDTIDPREKKE